MVSDLQLDALRDVAIKHHCPAEAYIDTATHQFDRAGWSEDVGMSRDICHDLGIVRFGGYRFAAFEIDESFYAIFVDENHQYVRVEVFEV